MLEAPSMSSRCDKPCPNAKPRGLRAIYAWMLENATGPHAWAAVAAFAFAEAHFFPIPADVMVLPMMLADRRRVFRLGAWVAFWSVAGGMLGYAIGASVLGNGGPVADPCPACAAGAGRGAARQIQRHTPI